MRPSPSSTGAHGHCTLTQQDCESSLYPTCFFFNNGSGAEAGPSDPSFDGQKTEMALQFEADW